MALERSDVFPNTATFGSYISHIPKNATSSAILSIYSLQMCATWRGVAVSDMGRISPPTNHIRSTLLLRIMQMDTLAIEFSKTCLMSFLFAIRGPSGTICLSRASPNGRLQESRLPAGKCPDSRLLHGGGALPCGRDYPPREYDGDASRSGRVSASPKTRPPLRSARPTPFGQLCGNASSLAYPILMRQTAVIPPELYAIFFSKLGSTACEMYSPHCFRRGAAHVVKGTGSPFDAVATRGIWNFPADRVYVDPAADVEAGVRNLFFVDSKTESPGLRRYLPILRFRRKKPVAGRSRFFHGRRGFLGFSSIDLPVPSFGSVGYNRIRLRIQFPLV